MARNRSAVRLLWGVMALGPVLGCGSSLDDSSDADAFYRYRGQAIALARVQQDPSRGRAYLVRGSQQRMVVKNRVIVKLAADGELPAILRAANGKLLEKLPLDQTYVVEGGGDALQTANLIDAYAGVEWAEPEFVGEVEPTFIPNDPHFKDAWFLQNTGDSGAGTAG